MYVYDQHEGIQSDIMLLAPREMMVVANGISITE